MFPVIFPELLLPGSHRGARAGRSGWEVLVEKCHSMKEPELWLQWSAVNGQQSAVNGVVSVENPQCFIMLKAVTNFIVPEQQVAQNARVVELTASAHWTKGFWPGVIGHSSGSRPMRRSTD
ncbi:hypothetical protein DPEC_G00273200 [Dallia pectoralis]|uniref:Uncharacterized protein n=1 Tax=Dallia pectoralis TaxID=75939 RepID=A0ACC2FQ31_DALPE|nr:hypothetical protein DPEC_G00273200 [Dallia pectoralis]